MSKKKIRCPRCNGKPKYKKKINGQTMQFCCGRCEGAGWIWQEVGNDK